MRERLPDECIQEVKILLSPNKVVVGFYLLVDGFEISDNGIIINVEDILWRQFDLD